MVASHYCQKDVLLKPFSVRSFNMNTLVPFSPHTLRVELVTSLDELGPIIPKELPPWKGLAFIKGSSVRLVC